MAPGCVQANLVVVPRAVASEFIAFAVHNPKPCPIVEVVEQGTEAVRCAPGSDLRTDVPRYRLFVDGIHTDSATDATSWWRDDLVAVLLGCSFSFEAALMRAGLPVRHIEQGRNVPMYVTDRRCDPAGDFAGPLVVSMRPMPEALVEQARRITEAYPQAHSGPVHVGDPAGLGISDLNAPDFGDPVDIPRRRGADVLGLRGHPAAGHRQRRPRDRYHPRARPHVHHRPACRSDNPGNKRRVGSLSDRDFGDTEAAMREMTTEEALDFLSTGTHTAKVAWVGLRRAAPRGADLVHRRGRRHPVRHQRRGRQGPSHAARRPRLAGGRRRGAPVRVREGGRHRRVHRGSSTRC